MFSLTFGNCRRNDGFALSLLSVPFIPKMRLNRAKAHITFIILKPKLVKKPLKKENCKANVIM